MEVKLLISVLAVIISYVFNIVFERSKNIKSKPEIVIKLKKNNSENSKALLAVLKDLEKENKKLVRVRFVDNEIIIKYELLPKVDRL